MKYFHYLAKKLILQSADTWILIAGSGCIKTKKVINFNHD